MTPAVRLLRCALPPSVQVRADVEALPCLDVHTRAATAQVFFHGAHVARWTPAHAGAPVLWLSAHSYFRKDKAIRGGVPICLPWFGPHPTDPTGPAHGFARLADWTLVEAADVDGAVTLTFALDTAAQPSPHWPHAARATYRLAIGTTLAMTLEVENVGATPFAFEEALHTYLTVGDIGQVSVAGLEDTDYLDKVKGFAREHQDAQPIRFTAEVDRVYLDTEATCRVIDPSLSRTIVVAKSGSRSTVVWNPWMEKARAFADFGDEEWRQMLCVETANVGAAAVRLEPGASHRMRAEVTCR